MKNKTLLSCLLVFTFLIAGLSTSVKAENVYSKTNNLLYLQELKCEIFGECNIENCYTLTRATGSINTEINANGIVIAGKSFSLEAGETVTINCSYSPSFASIDFGLLDSDGRFHYMTITGGSVNKTITIDQRGNYTLVIRNNSSNKVTVSGFISY